MAKANDCTACGAALSEGARFCKGCGTPVAVAAEPAAAEPEPAAAPPPANACPACGGDNAEGARFCRHCGGQMQAAPAVESRGEEDWYVEEPRRSRMPLLAGGLVAAIALGGGGWYAWNARQAPDPALTATPSAAASASAAPAQQAVFTANQLVRTIAARDNPRGNADVKIFAAKVRTNATPAEILGAASASCLDHRDGHCVMFFVAQNRDIPLAVLQSTFDPANRDPANDPDDVLARLAREGTVIGAFEWVKGSDRGHIRLDCRRYPQEARSQDGASPTDYDCFNFPEPDAAVSAADAAAAASAAASEEPAYAPAPPPRVAPRRSTTSNSDSAAARRAAKEAAAAAARSM